MGPFVIGSVGAVILSEATMDVLGFEAIGITAESVAAAVQSGIGDVEADSIFATLQSAGMAGMAATATFGIALMGAGVDEGVIVSMDKKSEGCQDDELLDVLKSAQRFVMDK